MVTDFTHTEVSVILSDHKFFSMHLHMLDNVPYLDTDFWPEDGRDERQYVVWNMPGVRFTNASLVAMT